MPHSTDAHTDQVITLLGLIEAQRRGIAVDELSETEADHLAGLLLLELLGVQQLAGRFAELLTRTLTDPAVVTIAHWIPATKRSLSDAAQVRTLIDLHAPAPGADQ